MPERVSYTKENVYSETFAYDIVEGVLIVAYSRDGDWEDGIEYEEGTIINKNWFIEGIGYGEDDFSKEDWYIYNKWNKMIEDREELKAKLNEATQGIPVYDVIIPPQNLNGVIEGFRFLNVV